MKKAKTTTTKPKKTPAPKKSGDIPVSYAALAETEQNLKHEITSVKVELRSVEKKLLSVEKKLEAKIETVLAAVHRVAALVEEQNSRNRYVLDGYTSLYDSQEDIKARLNELEKKSF